MEPTYISTTTMFDIQGGIVEVQYDNQTHRLWVNVDGVCRLRVQNWRHFSYENITPDWQPQGDETTYRDEGDLP